MIWSTPSRSLALVPRLRLGTHCLGGSRLPAQIRKLCSCRKTTTGHRGLVTICVLVCLLVVSSLAMLTMQSALRERREISLRHQMLQTELLLDAGAQLASSRLRDSADYQGETWQPIPTISQFPDARIVTRVSKDGERVEVIASLGSGSNDSARAAVAVTRRSHTFRIPTTKSSVLE